MNAILDGIATAVKAVAPTVATALGGPLAGSAVNMLLDKFLPADEAEKAKQKSLEEKAQIIEQAIDRATPQDLLKLKEVENEFKLAMRKLNVQEQALYLKDVQNARQREVELHDKNVSRLGWTVLVIWLILNVAVIWLVADPAITLTTVAVGILFRILGTLDGAVLSVLHYYFGTTKKEPQDANATSNAR